MEILILDKSGVVTFLGESLDPTVGCQSENPSRLGGVA